MGQLKELLTSKTLSHSAITFSGTIVNGVLGILFFVVIARFLGPAKFGVFSVSILALNLLADVADVGINSGLINFISKHVNTDENKVLKFMKLGLKYKFYSFLAIGVVGYIIAPFFSEYLLGKPELMPFLRISILGVGGALFFSFVSNCLQAFQKYREWSIINIFANAIRLFVIYLLITYGLLDTNTTLVSYIAVAYLGFFIGIFLLPRKFIFVKNEESERKEFFSYNKWIAISIIIAAIYSRLDTFITANLLDISEVGYYSVSNQLALVVPQIVYAFAVVVAPKIASYSEKNQAFIYFKKIQLYALFLAGLGLIGVPLSFYLIPLFYSNVYEASIYPFVILYLGQLLFLISTPAHQVIYYYFSRPKIMVYVSIVQLFFLAVSAYFLTLNFGIIGSAISVFLAFLLNFLITFLWVMKEFKK